jgi:hypothetical protein
MSGRSEMSGPGAGQVRCFLTLKFPGLRLDMFDKGSGHVQSFWSEKDLETLENLIIERFGV